MQVVKRDGSKVDFNLDKIKQVIAWSTENIKNVNPLILESSVDIFFKDSIKTVDIQNNLIQSSLQLCNIESPNWKYVSGRLLFMQYWKDTVLKRGYKYKPELYIHHLKQMFENGKYVDLFSIYDENELNDASKWIDVSLDLNYDYASVSLWKNRYLIEGELIQEALLTISLLIASVEKKENRLKYAKSFYEAVSQRKISLATPILSNLRKLNGNLSSCFILKCGDSLDSIMKTLTDVAQISKNGGGVGVNLSSIRCSGSAIKDVPGASNGVLPWVKLFNDTAVAVNQLGKRAGAVTVALDVWHMDILDFLDCQTEVGNQRIKSFDIFPQVIVYDLFMKRLENNQDWTLFDPAEIKKVFNVSLEDTHGDDFNLLYLYLEENINKLTLTKKIKAKEIWKVVVKNTVETGLPYICFVDTINAYNPNKDTGKIYNTNLCVESYSSFNEDEAHTCNLNSINLEVVDLKDIENIAPIAVRMLDNLIDITVTPIKESNKHNKKYRTIGVGVMGLADYIAKNNKQYTNSNNLVNELFETISYYCFKENVKLGKERGNFENFENSEFKKGVVLGKLFLPDKTYIDLNQGKQEHFSLSQKYNTKFDWYELVKQLNEYARCSQLLAIAPNSSTSLLMGATASILPIFSKFFYDKNSKGIVPISPPFIDDYFWLYQENKNIDQNVIVEMVGKYIQPWIDTGISMELCFNLNSPDVTAKFISDTYINAWKSGCKAIYYVRTIQKDGVSKEKEECLSCAN